MDKPGYSRNLFRKSAAQPAFDKEVIIEPKDIKNLTVKYDKKHLWSGLKDKEYIKPELRDDAGKTPKMSSADVVTMLDTVEQKVDQITNQVDIALQSLASGTITKADLERIRSSSMQLSSAVTQKKNVVSTGYTNQPALTNKGTSHTVSSTGAIIPPALPALPAPIAAPIPVVVVPPALPAPAPTPLPAPLPTPPPMPIPTLRHKPLSASDILGMFGKSRNIKKFTVLSKMFPGFFRALGSIEVDKPSMEAILDSAIADITQQDIKNYSTMPGSPEKELVRTKFNKGIALKIVPDTLNYLQTTFGNYDGFGKISGTSSTDWVTL